MSEFGVSASSQEASGRRFLTIEFIDLVGSTDLAERLDPEELGPLLRRYHRLALSVMERLGGFIGQVLNVGVLVYFGYPIALEHETTPAIRSGMTIHEQLRTLDSREAGTTLLALAEPIG